MIIFIYHYSILVLSSSEHTDTLLLFKLLIKLLSNIIEILKTISKSAITERNFFFII